MIAMGTGHKKGRTQMDDVESMRGTSSIELAGPYRQHIRTWFWTRSLTRSMGAAAVFETAAETPPTVMKQSVKLLQVDGCLCSISPCHVG